MSNIWDKIKDGAKDISSLTVTTLESKLQLSVSAAGNKAQPVDKLFESLKVKPIDAATAKVVAITHVAIDKDTTMIVGETANPVLVDHHQQTVADAIEARTAVMKLLADSVGFGS